jgi:hypothetical protein
VRLVHSWASNSTALLMVWLSLSLRGCGGSVPDSSTTNTAEVVSDFSGIASVEKQSDGSWVLSWAALSSRDAVYGIYRSEKENDMKYEEPYFTTSQSSYKYMPDNVLSEPQRCFAVRVLGGADENRKVICNDAVPTIFSGLKTLAPQSDGSYLLRWDKIPVDDAVYWIFDRQSTSNYNFSFPSFQESADFYATAVIPRGESKCYLVRVVHPAYGTDSNQRELCTRMEPAIEMQDTVLVAAGSSLDSRVVTWAESSTADVFGYKVFLDYTCELPAVCSEADGSGIVGSAKCTLNSLRSSQNVSYQVCVFAVDTAKRESRRVWSQPFTVSY